jgi:uncharacterized protein YraI
MANPKGEMTKREPVNARRGGALHRSAGSKFAVFHFRFVIAVLLALSVGLAWAQTNTATVAGAAHVFIRRGPGTEFPPFATLAEGSAVEIQEMHGEWARVLTASGQSGYVKSNFLALPAEHHAPQAAAPAHAAVPAVTPARSETAAVQQLTEENKSLTAQIGQLQEELAALKAGAEATPVSVSTAAPAALDVEKLHADLTRLTATVDQLEKRLQAEPPRLNVSPLPNLPADGPGRVVTSTTILLAAIGLCVGWLLGNAFGRRQERARRPRVRL